MAITLSASEAVYGFAGWLTSREEKTVMSSSDDAAPVAELVEEFCKENNLPEVTEGFPKNLTHPPIGAVVPVSTKSERGYDRSLGDEYEHQLAEDIEEEKNQRLADLN